MWITCAQPSLHSRLSPVPPPPELPPRRLDGPRGHGRGARAGTSDRGGARARQRPRQRNARARGAPRSDTETDTWHTNAYNTYWCMLYTFCISIYIHIYMLYNTFFKKMLETNGIQQKRWKTLGVPMGSLSSLRTQLCFSEPALLEAALGVRWAATGATAPCRAEQRCGTAHRNHRNTP